MPWVRLLRESGYEVFAVVASGAWNDLIEAGGAKFVEWKLSRSGRNPLAEIGSIVGLARIFRKIKPDIVQNFHTKPNIYAPLAARLAGVLAVMRGGQEITTEDIEAGITLANYYLGEAVRIADAGQIKQPLKDAEQLLQWIHAKGFRQVHPSLVYQNGPSRRLRTKESALKAIHTLQNHGWLTPMQAGEMEGSGRRQAWWVENV